MGLSHGRDAADEVQDRMADTKWHNGLVKPGSVILRHGLELSNGMYEMKKTASEPSHAVYKVGGEREGMACFNPPATIMSRRDTNLADGYISCAAVKFGEEDEKMVDAIEFFTICKPSRDLPEVYRSEADVGKIENILERMCSCPLDGHFGENRLYSAFRVDRPTFPKRNGQIWMQSILLRSQLTPRLYGQCQCPREIGDAAEARRQNKTEWLQQCVQLMQP